MRKNMKKFTRITSLIMASMLCLSACGNKPAEKSTDNAVSATPSDSTVVSSQEEEKVVPYWEMLDQVSDTSELPDWEGETLEIKVWHASGTDALSGEIADNDICYKEFERVTGVKFLDEESFDNGGNNMDAKLPMVIGSGDLPNLIMGYGILPQMQELFKEGYLADLTEYYTNGDLDQLTKWLPLEEMNTFVYSNAKTENGEYFLIPNRDSDTILANLWNSAGYAPEEVYDAEYFNAFSACPTNEVGLHGGHAFYVRDDILKALKPDALTYDDIKKIWMERGSFTEEEIYSIGLNSAEEFYDFLRDIKELLASGEYKGLDGKPMEVTYGGHTETDNWYMGVYWANLLKGVGSYDYFACVNKAAESEDDVIQFSFSNEFGKQHWKDINTLVREDLIAQDSFLDNAATFNEKLNNLHYAVAYVQDMPGIAEKAGSEISYTPIWVKVPFNTEIAGIAAVSYSEYYGIFKDTLTDDQLDQLIHAINYLNSVVGINNFFWGPKTAGLFVEDEAGNRSFVDEELTKCMIGREDNGAALKNGGVVSYLAKDNVFMSRPRGIVENFLSPTYLSKGGQERQEKHARTRYNAGWLEGHSTRENLIYVNVAPTLYGSWLNKVEGLNTFWGARNGFEDLVKKVYVAESDEEFEKQFQILVEYTEEYGLTEETRKQYNDLFVEANRQPLKDAGIID